MVKTANYISGVSARNRETVLLYFKNNTPRNVILKKIKRSRVGETKMNNNFNQKPKERVDEDQLNTGAAFEFYGWLKLNLNEWDRTQRRQSQYVSNEIKWRENSFIVYPWLNSTNTKWNRKTFSENWQKLDLVMTTHQQIITTKFEIGDLKFVMTFELTS